MAAGLAAALAALYSANGDLLWTNDAIPSTYGAANLVEFGRLSFTPSQDPWLFEWSTPGTGAPFRLWDVSGAVVDGVPAAELRSRGLLVARAPYYLAPTLRVDEGTGDPVYVSLYGPAVSVFAAPFLAAARLLAGRDLRAEPVWLWFAAKLSASLMAAASAAFVFLACRRWLALLPSLSVALVYGLATCVWSSSSQALWQHPSNALFLALGAFALIRAAESAPASALSGASFSLAVAARPTSAAFFAAAAVHLLLVDRRRLWPFLAAGAPALSALAAFNLYYAGSPVRLAQMAIDSQMTGLWGTPLWTGLGGLLLSPSRGLFVFSPFLLASLPGAVAVWRKPEYQALRPLTVATAFVLVVQAKWIAWWGGHSYGYRIISDLAVMLCLFLVPVLPWIARRRALASAFLALVAWSVALQAAGAFVDHQTWNARPGVAVLLPSGETVVREVEAFPEPLPPERGLVVGHLLMDVNRPEFQHRLWSLDDSSIRFLWDQGVRGRRPRRRQTRAWIEQFRPPEGAALPGREPSGR